MRIPLIVVAFTAISACSPSIPDSAAGVGFDDYSEYEAKRKAQATTPTGCHPPAPSRNRVRRNHHNHDNAACAALGHHCEGAGHAPPPAPPQVSDSADLAAETQAHAWPRRAPIRGKPRSRPTPTIRRRRPSPLQPEFQPRMTSKRWAMSARSRAMPSSWPATGRNIRWCNPPRCPHAPGDVGPNIVDYALSTRHPIGTKVYSRIGINKAARYQKNCAKYASADRAQKDFLSKGGPRRDKMGLDPDGDGYACSWNPEPFRRAVSG